MTVAKPIVLVGPTAGGKSALAIALAQRLGGEIVSADSMQVYRHMDAGTAKPSPAERALVPHHLIDCVAPTQRFTVADWLSLARDAIAAIHGRGRQPIVVGGTNLYIKALLEGLAESPAVDPGLRERLAAAATADLHAQLARIDPDAAGRIHPNDRKRLTRAIEVFELTGQPLSAMQTQWGDAVEPTALDAVLIGLHWPIEAINRRINLRVKAMFFPDKAREQDGLDPWEPEDLVAETRRLDAAGLLGTQAREALGYKQVLAHLRGELSLEEAFERTKVQTRRFAKQQRTWLKRFTGVHWLAAEGASTDTLRDAALGVLASPGDCGRAL